MSTTTDTMPTASIPVGGPKPRKPRRVFMWTFLGVQILFLIWLIAGMATAHTDPAHAQVLQGCAHGAWRGLFTSRQDCMIHYANGLREAGQAGTAIGVGLVIGLWVAVDAILGIGRLIVLTARRRTS